MSSAMAKIDRAKLGEEEYQYQLALERSRLEGEAAEAVRRKNEALRAMMAQLE